jgi:hypothetical protein
LLYFDWLLARGSFRRVHAKVREFSVRERSPAPDAVERLCAAVDLACVFYWKQVLCLQRSAATVCLLKRSGVPALLVIGAQPLPFKAHAWVEVEGSVVNDKTYMREIYAVLDFC